MSDGQPSITPPARTGELLAGKYRIGRLLGEGGMGTVYEAQHTVVGRRFAVKFLHSELARQDDLLARFRREAYAAGSLESENIASIVDFGQREDGVPYIVMELLIGDDLSKLLAQNGPMPVARAVNIVIQICRGLDAAHAVGIVHRDLKPENIFVCRRGDGSDLVKILDFGIAKLGTPGVDGPVSPRTRTGATLGTPFYMPPEQARGEKEIDHRADVYALGVILFEALAGEKPHPGDSYNAILYHILTQAPAPLDRLRAGLPPELTEIVHRAMAFQPADRPASAMELARSISRFAGRQVTPLTSQFELRVTRPSGSDATPSPIAATPAVTRAPARPPIKWIAAGAAIGVAAAALIGLVVLRIGQGATAKATTATGTPAIATGTPAPATASPPVSSALTPTPTALGAAPAAVPVAASANGPAPGPEGAGAAPAEQAALPSPAASGDRPRGASLGHSGGRLGGRPRARKEPPSPVFDEANPYE